MTKVFFGGSRNIARISAEVRRRIDNVVARGLTVLVGDANGADKALQKYLADKKYDNVVVYCSGHSCRNNIGNWKTEFVPSNRSRKDFEHFALKDARMGKDADYGLFLWDGKSRGTLTNLFRLIENKKQILLYFSPGKHFVQIRRAEDLKDLLPHCDPKVADSVERRLADQSAAVTKQLDLA